MYKSLSLKPIYKDMRLNSAYLDKSQHYEIIEAFITTYVEFGFVAPWIGYFVFDDEHNIVGCGGFKESLRMELLKLPMEHWMDMKDKESQPTFALNLFRLRLKVIPC